MPRLLGAADSFNSSGATIVPDNRRSSFSEHHPLSALPNGRSLMPHDTLGMELEDALRGGTPTPMDAESQGQWDLLRQLVNSGSSQPSSSQLQPQESLDFSSLLNDNAYSQTSASQEPLPLPTARQVYNSNGDFPYRPSSAHSHRSSVSSSNFSYISTEMDTDPEPLGSTSDTVDVDIGGMHVDPNHLRANGMDSVGGSLSPDTRGNSPIMTVSPREIGSVGPIRGIEDDGKKKHERLEHRRDINRRSAQKHRALRKEQVESLNHAIAERDAKIARLERELAVEKGKLAQVVEFIKTKPGFIGNPG